MNILETSKLYKAYDIRGQYPVINATVAYWTGFYLVKNVLIPQSLSTKVVVMRDGRSSSPELYEAFCSGVLNAEGELVPIGMGSSDMMYQAVITHECAGAIITASHNPKQDNGIKMVSLPPHMLGMDSGLQVIHDAVIKAIMDEKLIKLHIFQDDEAIRQQMITDFTHTIRSYAPSVKPLKVVIDAGNGMGGVVMEEIVKDLFPQVQFVPLYWEVDENFPNHQADPSKYENLKDLQRAVIAEQADLGMAFDGDADRAFFVDEQGEIIHADFTAAIMAQHILSKEQAKVVYPFSSSRVIKDVVEGCGGEIIQTKQGHTYIKQEMAAQDGIFGSEYSGHYYFRSFDFMDSGAIALALMLQIVSDLDIPISEKVNPFREKYHVSPSVNIPISDNIDFADIADRLIEAFPGGQINKKDGLLVTFEDYKFMVRKSNTEPKLRVVVETIGENRIDEILDELKKIILD